jgi:hypothetical protein
LADGLDRRLIEYGIGDDGGVHRAESILVLIGVVLAEEKFSTSREDRAHAGSRTTPVAPVGSGQWGAGQCSGHDSSVLAFGVTRLPGAGPPRRYGAVRTLFQTIGSHVLFPRAFLCVVTNTKHKETCWPRVLSLRLFADS